nr:hypothetical protein [Tanacetum cinerariifolium]
NRGQGTNPRGRGAAGYGGVQNRVGNANPGQARQNSDYYKDKMLLMQAQENGVALDKEQLLFLAADECEAFDSDVNEAPTAQTMFMANLSSADPVYDKAGPSYDSDILSEVHDRDPYQDAVCEHHEEYAMHDNVQLNHVVDSHVDYTSDSNTILYDEYVKDNAVPVVHKKVEDRLFKQDQSLQTVHMLCRPKPYYNELNKVTIGYKNPLCLTRAKQVQPALYNGHEIIKDNHVPAIMHNTEDTLEIAEITRKKMNNKMKDPECVTRKENFEGIQKALTKEIKEMKDVFEELEAEVTQNVVDRKHDEIEQKNLLIANDNLFVECLSKEVFLLQRILSLISVSVATNFELNVARFTEMHVINTIVEAHCLELEVELSNLRDKSHNDNHDELVNRFSNLEDKVIKKLQKQISHLQETRSEADRTLDFRALDSQITQLTAKVTALQAQNDMFRAENGKIKQHYKELYDSIKITRTKHIEQVLALTTENVNLKAQILNTVNSVSRDHVKPKVLAPGKYAIDVEPIVPHLRNNREAHLDYLRHLKESVKTICEIVEEAKVKTNVPVPPSTGVNRCTDASRSQPRSNTKKNRILPTKAVNKMQVEAQPRINKSLLRTTNRVDSSSRSKSTVINSNSDSVCQTCNKCLISANHDMSVVDYLQSVVTPPLFVIIVMLCAKLRKFGNLRKLGKYGNPQEKYLPVLVINGDPLAGYSP